MNARARNNARTRGGFSLLEVMVATAILAIFGLMAVTTLRYGTQLWRDGNRRSSAYDTAAMIFQQLEDDIGADKSQFWGLSADAYDTRIKLWVDRTPADPNDNRQRMRLVRGIPDDAVNPRLRRAGDNDHNDDDDNDGTIGDAGDQVDEEWYNLRDDDVDMRVDEDMVALGGMCEVAYLMGRDQEVDGQTLYRAVLSPIGQFPGGNDGHGNAGEDHCGWTFFSGVGNGGVDDDSLGTPDRIQNKALPLAQNVLYFEVRLWTQYTTTWDLWDSAGNPMYFERWDYPIDPEPCGPVFVWDSDRLDNSCLQPEAQAGPEFQMDWEFTDPDTGIINFPVIDPLWDADGDGVPNHEDEDYVRDNVFPRAIMVVLVIQPENETTGQTSLRLARLVNSGEFTIPVTGNVPRYNEGWPYLLIEDPTNGNEWVRFTRFDPDTNAFILDTANDPTAERGTRWTADLNHAAGLRVKLGYTFSRVFFNPAGRDYWEH